MEPDSFVTIGLVARPQGRKGELKVVLETDFPERFAALRAVWLFRAPARARFQLRRAWPHQGHIILELAEINSISQAEIWAGAEVQVPIEQRWPAPEGSYFISDLVGCEVWNQQVPLGPIEAVRSGAGAPLLEVRAGADRLILIPFARAYLENLDLAGRVLRLRLPEGLLDL